MQAKRKKMLIGDLAVLLVALIWGATNVVIRDALGDITPFWFCALRFIIAWTAVMLIFGKRAMSMDLRAKAAGTFTGMVFICAYLAGAVGLLYTTAGNQSLSSPCPSSSYRFLSGYSQESFPAGTSPRP